MSLNIKNPHVHELAREAARLTGKTQTSVIEEALVRLLQEYGADPEENARQRKLAELREISRRFREDEPSIPADAPIRTVEDLYDEKTGLPK